MNYDPYSSHVGVLIAFYSFRTTPSLSTTFESRRLPRAFIILLETLLSVSPSGRPSCERILGAIREGRVRHLPRVPRDFFNYPCSSTPFLRLLNHQERL